MLPLAHAVRGASDRRVPGEDGRAWPPRRRVEDATQTLFGGDVTGKTAAELETIFKDVKSAEMATADVVGKPVYAVAAAAGMFKSNGEARRMASQGGLSLNGAKVDDKRVFEASDLIEGKVAILKQGKKNNFLLKTV